MANEKNRCRKQLTAASGWKPHECGGGNNRISGWLFKNFTLRGPEATSANEGPRAAPWLDGALERTTASAINTI